MRIRRSRWERIAMLAWEPMFRAVVRLTVLLEMFLTMLDARVGTGILSPKFTRLMWRLFRDLPAGRSQPIVLPFGGPAIRVLLVLTLVGAPASGPAVARHSRTLVPPFVVHW